jgi:hypothetical protein
MFYSVVFAGADKDATPLQACWQACHRGKLKKQELASFSIPAAAHMICAPLVHLSLRCASALSRLLALNCSNCVPLVEASLHARTHTSSGDAVQDSGIPGKRLDRHTWAEDWLVDDRCGLGSRPH